MSGFRSSTIRNIKKAKKLGIQVSLCSSLKFIDLFFELNCQTRKQHGLPPQPYAFFKNLYKHMMLSGLGRTAIAFYRDRPVAGAIFLSFGNQVIYKYGASDSRFSHLRPNNLVMWEAIKWYAQKNYKELHMGRTELAHTGLDQYKSGWGTTKNHLLYYRYHISSKSFITHNGHSHSSMEKCFSNLPISFLRLFGKLAYRHFG
jgi:lipid II:glycine glycyltransferase (peptidoglycan interpeptide bridge formation enzyme)